MKIYKNLYKYFGPQGWWPILQESTPQLRSGQEVKNYELRRNNNYLFEICVGAILTQNTAWTNVEKALKNLVIAGLTSPEAIAACQNVKLARLIRPSGYFRQKTKKLKIFSSFLIKNYNGNLRSFFKCQLSDVRCQLLSLWGIGPETADSMILYAASKPTFVVDAYTRRLCRCFSLRFKTYDEYKNFFENQLPPSAKLFNEYHALIVAWGKLLNQDPEKARELLT